MKIRSLFPEIWAKLWKNAISRNVEESFKKFLYPDSEADDIQKLISFPLFTYTSLVNFHENRFGSFYAKLLTDRQTDRQTPGIAWPVVSLAIGHWGTCPPPRLQTVSFLVHFGVNLGANYPSIVQSARLADADVNNSQLFRSVLH